MHMTQFFAYERLVRAPDNGGAGGADGGSGNGAGGANESGAGDDPSLIDLVGSDDAGGEKKAAPGQHPAVGEKPAGADGDRKGDKPQRPDFIEEPYWDPEKGEVRLESMAKALKDARALISKGAHKAPPKPEDYKINMPEGVKVEIPADDPLLVAFRAAAHAEGVSQATFDKLVAPALKILAEKQANVKTPEQLKAEREEAVKAELAKLGKNGEAIVKSVATWGRGLMEKGIISKEEWQEFRFAAGTAAGVRLLSKLQELAMGHAIPLDAGAVPETGSLDDYYKLRQDPNYDKDPALQRKAKAILENLEKAGLLPDRPPAGIGIARA